MTIIIMYRGYTCYHKYTLRCIIMSNKLLTEVLKLKTDFYYTD